MIEETESPLTRINLESRLQAWEAEVATAVRRVETLAEVSVLFDGEPVKAKVGIDAAFGGQGVRRFEEFVAHVDADMAPGGVGRRGPLATTPRLFITDVAGGSFGFQLAEIPEQESLASPSRLKTALDTATQLLESAADSDEAFSEALAFRHPRVLSKLKAFLEVVDDYGATLRVNTGKARATLASPDKVHSARVRADAADYEEHAEDRVGVLIGLMQDRRHFELRTTDGGVISGRISSEIDLGRLAQYFDKEVFSTLSRIVITHVGREKTAWVLECVTDPPPKDPPPKE